MKHSIVPEMIKSEGMKFLDERDIEIKLCDDSYTNYIIPFEKPYIIVNTFAKKTIKPSEFVFIDIDELKKLGYYLVAVRTSNGWEKHQKIIYKLESENNRTPGASRKSYLPQNHKIQKDIPNKRIRIVGTNAGFPHYESEFGGAGPWIAI